MPSPIVVDTGPLVALFDAGDRYHEQALRFVQRTRSPLVSSLAVVTEVIYVLDDLLGSQLDFLAWVKSGALRLVEPTPEDWTRVGELLGKYSDVPMDFVDGLLVAICERFDIRTIATVDRDFTIYRFRGRSRFVNALLTE